MKWYPVLGLMLIFFSCSKDELNCVAKNANGEEMYEVVGSDVCEDQISQEKGEYCDCME